MTTRGSIGDTNHPRAGESGARTSDAGPEIAAQLRQAAVHVETAAVLERRAGRTDDPAVAALLRERARARRRTAERLRAAVTGEGAPAPASRRAAAWG